MIVLDHNLASFVLSICERRAGNVRVISLRLALGPDPR